MGGQVRSSIEDAMEEDVSASEQAVLSRCGFLKLCGGGLAALTGLVLLGAAGCGNGEDQQDDRQDAEQQNAPQHTTQQDAVREVDRCLERC